MVDPGWARVEGPLAPYVDGFRSELARLGYTPLSSAVQVRLMAQLSNRLAGQLSLIHISEPTRPY